MMVTRLVRVSLCGIALAAMGCVVPPPRPHAVYVVSGPPADVVEVVPAQPGPEFIWIGGHYRWDDGRYVWMSGHWAKAPEGYHEWIAGHWARRDGGWLWVEGHWR